MRRVLLFATAAVLLLALACAGVTEAVLFYEDGCPHCERMKALLQEIEDAGGALTVRLYAVSSPEARDLLPRLLSAYGAEMGPVPLLFVANVAVVRDTFYSLDATPVSLSGRAADLEIKGIVEKSYVLTHGGDKLPLPKSHRADIGQEVIYGIRPEDLEVGKGFPVKISVTEPTGPEIHVYGDVGDHEVCAIVRERQTFKRDSMVEFAPRLDKVHLFDAKSTLALR